MKKIISLLAACTLFAVCLPVSAADAVTEDSALLQNSVVEQTDPYTFYFVPERTYVSAEEVQAGDVHIPTKVYIKGNTHPAKQSPVHAFAIRAIPAAFILQQQQHSQHNGYVQAILQWRFFFSEYAMPTCFGEITSSGTYTPLQLCTADQCPADRTVQRFFHSERWSWRHHFTRSYNN